MLERLKLKHIDGSFCLYTMVYRREHPTTAKFSRRLREGARSDLGVIYKFMISELFITVTYYRKYSDFKQWFEAKIVNNPFFDEKYFSMENIPLILDIEEELRPEQVIALETADTKNLELLMRIQSEYPMTYKKLQGVLGQSVFSMASLQKLLLSKEDKNTLGDMENIETLVTIQEDILRAFFKRKTETEN